MMTRPKAGQRRGQARKENQNEQGQRKEQKLGTGCSEGDGDSSQHQ